MIVWPYENESQIILWDWSWSWYFIVVSNKCFCSWKICLHWHCLRIDIHEIIHVNLNFAVTMKPIQLCIVIYSLWLFCIWFFFLNTFYDSTVRTFNIVSQLYLKIIPFFPIHFFIHNLSEFNCCDSSFLFQGVI